MGRNCRTGVLVALKSDFRLFKNISGRYAGPLLLIGLVGIVLYNLRLWRNERNLADRLKAKRASSTTLSRQPKISSLVAAWNAGNQVDAHLHSFLELNYPDIELILCAGGEDGTLERARRYASERVIVLEQHPGEGKQRALARCLKHASGEVIYLTDIDCRYVDGALEQLLAPLVEEGEQAVTGGSYPLDEQANKVLPAYLWASDAASAARFPTYINGILGRNAAITRAALERSGGLDFPAPTGTDYHLAQRLNQRNIAIRFVSTSVVPTEYPEGLSVYRRKQSRWIRNLLLYGFQYGAWQDVRRSLQTVVIGLMMLLAPLTTPVFGKLILTPWALLVAQAASSKLRYVLFTARVYQKPISLRLLASILPLALVDFAIWASPILDLINPRRRTQW